MSAMRCLRCREVFVENEDGKIEGFDVEMEMCDPCAAARAAIVPPLDVEAVFARGGPLAGDNPDYETRPGQVRLARAIADALIGNHHLLAEGPCGIGKSMAYGVPAAWLASHEKKVMIVTASIALQEQLVKKDLPALQKMLCKSTGATPSPWDFDFALMKGKSNYACPKQLEVLDNDGLAYDDALAFKEVNAWVKETKTGDKGELLIKPSDLVWRKFSTTSDECGGRKCSAYKDKTCFWRKARDHAAGAGILVTNYHLFFLNMASGGQILPAADCVIFDEGHEAADIARDLLGFSIGAYATRRLAKDAEKRKRGDIAQELREAGDEIFDTLLRFARSEHYKNVLRWTVPISPERVVDAIGAFLDACPHSHLVDYALRARATIEQGLTLANENCVYSIDVKEGPRGATAKLQAKYVSPAPVLTAGLWEAYPSVVVASATLTTDNRFTFVRQELGVPAEANEISVESPFDFRAQAMLVVPRAEEIPEPNDPRFLAVAAAKVIETIEACGGRTLGLFTSYRAVNEVYDRVRQHFNGRFRILKQGDMPTGLLAKTFKEDVRSVLLATTSFWTGIDVPGQALTGLVIDKLPFGMPDDPVSIRINETNPKAFQEFTVPKSILVFRQGVGRLIRSQRDVGAIVVLDKRVVTMGYGSRFLRSLPPMMRAASTREIAPFLRSKGVAA